MGSRIVTTATDNRLQLTMTQNTTHTLNRNRHQSMSVHIIDFSKASSNPLNPLGINLRKYIWQELDRALEDEKVTSVVLSGGIKKSGNFSSGADIKEFSQLDSVASGTNIYSLVDIVEKIENFPKPVVVCCCSFYV